MWVAWRAALTAYVPAVAPAGAEPGQPTQGARQEVARQAPTVAELLPLRLDYKVPEDLRGCCMTCHGIAQSGTAVQAAAALAVRLQQELVQCLSHMGQGCWPPEAAAQPQQIPSKLELQVRWWHQAGALQACFYTIGHIVLAGQVVCSCQAAAATVQESAVH